ncbi:MAG: hypothetical protein O3B84_04570 [Chloroflexi bacterium]|nr:hypothetical protein [Chloroflexota bacterium]
MKYTLSKVSQDAETKEHVLVLKQVDGEDLLALNIQAKEAVVLTSLLGPAGLPGPGVLDHLRDTATKNKGQVVAIQLLLYAERSRDDPALTPVLVVRSEGMVVEQAVPASLAHAAAWSLALDLPFEIDDELMSLLQGVVTIIPGEVPSGFRGVLAGLDSLDTL